uniref:Uncharacterized protein n=1 Tax=Anopheles merus TaxID=30066 RepID=A0A182UZZ1_ANOME
MVVVRMVVMMVATVMLLMLMAARLIARVARSRRATVVVVLPHREHVTLGHVSTVLGAERPVRADGRRQQVDVRPELVRCLVGGPAVNAPGWRHGGGLRELAERRPDRAVHRGRRAVVAELFFAFSHGHEKGHALKLRNPIGKNRRAGVVGVDDPDAPFMSSAFRGFPWLAMPTGMPLGWPVLLLIIDASTMPDEPVPGGGGPPDGPCCCCCCCGGPGC